MDEALTIGLEFILATTPTVWVIQEKIKAAQSCRFRQLGRLTLRYVSPYSIIKRVGEAGYQL